MITIKHLAFSLLTLLSLSVSFTACSKGNDTVNTENDGNDNGQDTTTNKMNITIGSTVFKATLSSNATARAFKKLLPLTINMADLNANEKHTDLSSNLPTNASNPGNIQNGDIMLYGSKTLVLFYKTFSTGYTYTKLGRVDNLSGWVAALGSGSVTVKFELAQP